MAIAGLAVVLAVIGGAMLVPASPGNDHPASRSIAPFVPYREGIVGHPSSINPLTPRTQADQDLVALLFRGLVREGPDGTILPDLAESWTRSDDGRTYTFQLVSDALWEDGEPVTAADVAYTIGILQDPAYDGPYGSSWQGIHVKADSPSTVRFTMTLPIAGFLRQAALPILPQHLLGDVSAARLADSAYSTRPVGDGPYRLVALSQSHAVLQRVPAVVLTNSPLPSPGPSSAPSSSSASSGGSAPSPSKGASASQSAAPTPTPTPTQTPTPTPTATPSNAVTGPVSALDTIELDFFDDPQSAAAQFAAGKLDVIGGLTPEQIDSALAVPGSRLIAYRWTSLLSVVLNQRTDHPEMRDVNARSGLLAAINRGALLARVLEGRGSTAELPIPSWS
ncbi:MAG: ABC transporter substrate-binding protein, partial [Candidatus Limnocylindrales bacterium]